MYFGVSNMFHMERHMGYKPHFIVLMIVMKPRPTSTASIAPIRDRQAQSSQFKSLERLLAMFDE